MACLTGCNRLFIADLIPPLLSINRVTFLENTSFYYTFKCCLWFNDKIHMNFVRGVPNLVEHLKLGTPDARSPLDPPISAPGYGSIIRA